MKGGGRSRIRGRADPSDQLMAWLAEARCFSAPHVPEPPGFLWVSTTWASDAIPQRKNHTSADRPAEVCLVAWIPTRKVAQSAASHSLRKQSVRGGHFGPAPGCCCAPPPCSLSQNGASFRSALGEVLAVKPAPFLVSVGDNAMLPQRTPEPELGTAAGEN